ncbi:DUF1295 domain-containing protein [Allobranchiibius huperziae]|uniref:Steroid 5-alpha reductase family enzyme n=1 Tax=Allobranchiibius huperziae TaxID=1874116 RepID=A0A853DJL8_9MICO|nr:steroid 5-alpha reductase family enzyme [Allobranchiibius huperziae]
MADFLLVSGVSLLLLAVLQAVTFFVGRAKGRYNVVDVIWGSGLALVALVALVLGTGGIARRITLAVLVIGWGARLSYHIWKRSRGGEEDPRYAELLEGKGTGAIIGRIFVTQWIAQWFISLPVQVAGATHDPRGIWWVVAVVGALVTVFGIAFEAIGDAQMSAFKADPANKGTIMDRGLWGWTRHPNYFGDACVWVGVYLVSASVWPGVLTVLSPVAMVFFLVVATGARRLEKSMAQREGYRNYQERTSFFVPTPPGKHT